jgi:uncharacterized repeat protein (TIGR03803 family)
MKILRSGCVFAAFLLLAVSMSAQFTTLASFGGSNGATATSLIQGSDGNFYGTTAAGGANGDGTVFKMTAAGVLTTLYSFCPQSGCTDGETPESLMQASNGNFYGTARAGGANGGGTVFQITSAGVLTTLYSFCSQSGCTDGSGPVAALVQASNGNLYGTTVYGGAISTSQCYFDGTGSSNGCGTIFQITPAGVFTTLYSFCSQSSCSDGFGPMGALMQASNGNLYGTNLSGGYESPECNDSGCGTIFEITPGGTLTTLYTFVCTMYRDSCNTGRSPSAGLVQAANGNFYGTTSGGGFYLDGTVFEITPAGALTTLRAFCADSGCTDGSTPLAGLVAATNGNFYGTTSWGGANTTECGGVGCGTVFEITAAGELTTLYSFCSQSDCTDGQYADAGLVQASNGNLYGITTQGGASGYGTVFSLSLGLTPTTLTSSPNPSGYGNAVIFTASVPAAATGTVTFTYGSTTLCNAVPLSRGTATCTYSALPAGSDVVTATYSGDANFSSNSGSVSQIVGNWTTATTLTSSPNPSSLNQQVTFTATVTSIYGGTPTGSVTFSNGSTTLGTAALSAGTATLSTAALPVGFNLISAVYSGDSNYSGSSSNILSQNVAPPLSPTLQANIAGSTAFWLEAGEAAYTLGGTTTTCAWTSSSAVGGTSFVLDQRYPLGQSPSQPQIDYGAVWVEWTPGTAGGTCASPDTTSQVWAYIGLDSVAANRCFFAQPQCTLNAGSFNPSTGVVTPLASGTAGANALSGITDTPLPANVLTAFNGKPITIAATDILPVDAAFASYSTLATPCGSLGSGTQFIGLGYGLGSFPLAPVNSHFSENYANVNSFSVYGNDPMDGNPIPPYAITPVGAIPVIVAVNTSNANGFGSPQVMNVNRADLAGLFTAFLGRTADAIDQPFAGTGATYYGVSALIPSPLSGSYNIFEHSIPNNKEMYDSLDSGNCGANGAPAGNPLDESTSIGSTTSYRYRVIGTNEMLSKLQSTQDSIGFELWSTENFAGTSDIKYLSVDGVDPFFSSYSDGTIPQSANGLLPNVTFTHVADGSYPLWNEERLISSPANSGLAATFASYTQSQLSFGDGAIRPDFIPDSQLNVFHMHFAPDGVTFNATNTAADGPKVCGAGAAPEDGGDVGGLVLTLQAGGDFCVLKGNYGTATGTGPTNTASFGVRQ